MSDNNSSSSPLIELTHCSLVLGERTVLDDITFALHPGQRWALIGPNGAGKTLLLKMIRGDMWPTPDGRERRVHRLDDSGIAYVGPERQDKYVRYGWNLTVEQLVTTGLFDEDIPLTRPSRSERERVARLLRRFGLTRLRARHILRLSYGQRRLALVARAFAGPARVLLLDEVFNGLDTKTKRVLKDALERSRGGHEWVLTSHRPKELPVNVTHVAHMSEGRIVALAAGRAATASIRSAPASIVVRHAAPMPAKRRNLRARRLVRIRHANVYRDYRLVLRSLDWTIERGEHWAIEGRNGSGKSTLLSLLYGDLHPALGGTIERDRVPTGTRIEEWKRRVGCVSPELQADHYLARSIEEIVVSGRYSSVGLDAEPTRTDRASASRWLGFFGIAELRDRGPRQVSYGQMRLALIARAMMNDPELLLLDEPCTGLDRETRAHVLAALQALAERGTQLVMAVHDREDRVPAVNRILTIERGGRWSTSCFTPSPTLRRR